MGNFPLEVQQAFLLHSLLSDRWEGMSGYYMGKDWSPLSQLLDIQEVEDKKTVTYFLKHVEGYHTININSELKRKQDADKRRAR